MIPLLPILVLHVVIAVVGVGVFGAIPIVAAAARQETASLANTDALATLFRYTRWSLVLILTTGVLVEYAAHGAFHTSGWFRTSFGLLLLLGFAHARARATFRKANADGGDRARALRRVEGWGWTMCVTVVIITLLMEAKPF